MSSSLVYIQNCPCLLNAFKIDLNAKTRKYSSIISNQDHSAIKNLCLKRSAVHLRQCHSSNLSFSTHFHNQLSELHREAFYTLPSPFATINNQTSMSQCNDKYSNKKCH